MNIIEPVCKLSFFEKLISNPVALMSLMSSIIIAVITIIILIRQYKYQKLSFKGDMFDKKVKVYSDVMSFISTFIQTRKIAPEDHFHFYSCVTFSELLFNEKVYNYVLSVYDKAVKHATLTIELDTKKDPSYLLKRKQGEGFPERNEALVKDEINELNKKISNSYKWFIKQLKDAPNIIKEDIKIK